MAKIIVKNLTLDYPIVGVSSRSLKNRIIGAATGGMVSGGESVRVVRALNNVNFELNDGDRLALIGHNGAGKSTLLRVLAGIFEPSFGSVSVSGRVVSTLNLNLGMESEATGIENIVSRGLLLGMPRAEINSHLEEIACFTELGEFLDMPVRIYSSGMLTRLAFGTVTAMQADVLLMDEVIGTGDASFMDKAERRLNAFMQNSKILVLASHSESVLKKFCNKGLLLDHGNQVRFGEIGEVIAEYEKVRSR
ncbi:ABC transporter ATP-binding protein [Permianibacter aggregans]|uniref:ABC-2 type transport system ATP-binding protein/lipopolysaccharide transport system ATP-binding protein n=1 Tax=Permianibacter aggregans TaxID=1510150 RepID=A0A4R6UV70_9GAMM|nr:ABC transporter ATP-binding protein [Permianibacter aggregans]QGX41326.1 ABC transporter ATP-binding protein [Permianibacter aggregans]TDQ51112.1 ABC-2 type transport system ATP-binding protein/lipopolysaccharide transport system ATP-binding protein [Permianibacter aggregans]